jgi:hypothetical protein
MAISLCRNLVLTSRLIATMAVPHMVVGTPVCSQIALWVLVQWDTHSPMLNWAMFTGCTGRMVPKPKRKL